MTHAVKEPVLSLSLPSSSLSRPVRFLYGSGVFPPSDPEQILTDRIEQWCAKQQSDHQSRDARMIDLRVQALQELDRAILALQLVTQSNWGPGQNYRFLNVRPAAMEKDIVCFASLVPLVTDLTTIHIPSNGQHCQASLLGSASFAAAIARLKTRWSIEERDNRVIVDLLPLVSIVRAESPYFCILTARALLGQAAHLAVLPNSDISDFLQFRKRLIITTRGFHQSSPPSASAGPASSSSPDPIEAVLCEFQEICLDHAVFQALLMAAASGAFDRRQWTVMTGDCSLQFVSLADPANIRTLAVQLLPTDAEADTQTHSSLAQSLRREFLRSPQPGRTLAAWLLQQ